MADLREVFEMVKQQTEPDKDSWAEQERRIRQSQRKRKYGAIALVAALVVVIAVVVASNLDADDQGVAPASDGPTPIIAPGHRSSRSSTSSRVRPREPGSCPAHRRSTSLRMAPR